MSLDKFDLELEKLYVRRIRKFIWFNISLYRRTVKEKKLIAKVLIQNNTLDIS